MQKSLYCLILLGIFGLVVACANASTPAANSFVPPSATIERPPVRSSLLDGTPVPPPQVSGKFIFAPGDGRIWLHDPANGKPTPGCAPQLLCLFAKPASADGLPWDLWSVTPDGSKFRRLTQIGADSPWAAWSRDSKQVTSFDTCGQYLLDIPTQVVSQISRNGGHGMFGWWKP